MLIEELDLIAATEADEQFADEGLKGCLPIISCFTSFTDLL